MLYLIEGPPVTAIPVLSQDCFTVNIFCNESAAKFDYDFTKFGYYTGVFNQILMLSFLHGHLMAVLLIIISFHLIFNKIDTRWQCKIRFQ